MKGYPIFLIGLEAKRCVVVGWGHDTQNKVKGLLDCDAPVTLVSPKLSPPLREWIDQGRIEWLARGYQPGDLRGAFLVIATGTDRQVNARIWEEAQAEGALINAVDDPPHCDFIAGSVLRQGPLTIAISTGGAAPALAVRLRERMKREFGPEYAEFLNMLHELRQPLSERYPEFQRRRALWYALIDSDVLELLRANRPDLAQKRIAEIVGFEVAPQV